MFLALAGVEEAEVFRQAAEENETSIRRVMDPQAFLKALTEQRPKALFVDVTSMDLDGVEAVETIKRDSSARTLPLVAFGNSLRADRLQDAQEAGADLVLPRAAFHDQLSGIIRRYSR